MSPTPFGPATPVGLVVIAPQVACVAHAVRAGRVFPWVHVIVLLPVVGMAAHGIVEVLPGLAGSRTAAWAGGAVLDAVAPLRQYEALRRALDVAPTVFNMEALARECLAAGRSAEALTPYLEIQASPQGDEPRYGVGRARALLELGRAEEAAAAIDELRARHPTFYSTEAHLLHARTLEVAGRPGPALVEYDALVGQGGGGEVRYRRAALLVASGRGIDARDAVDDLVRWHDRSPSHVRRREVEWVRAARRIPGL